VQPGEDVADLAGLLDQLERYLVLTRFDGGRSVQVLARSAIKVDG